MSTKYQTAYCDVTDTFISTAETEKLETEQFAFYNQNILGHLWCPGCKKVMLSLVHKEGKVFFRGHPKQAHAENCSYLLPVYRAYSVEKLINEEGNLERIQQQMQRLLRYTATNSKSSKVKMPVDVPTISFPVPRLPRYKLRVSRLPERRIDLPLTADDYLVTKVFYGTVRITSTCGKKNPNTHYLTLFSVDSKEKICSIGVNANVWRFLCKNPLLQGKQTKVRISFCGELKKSSINGALFCNLIRSQLLTVQPG